MTGQALRTPQDQSANKGSFERNERNLKWLRTDRSKKKRRRFDLHGKQLVMDVGSERFLALFFILIAMTCFCNFSADGSSDIGDNAINSAVESMMIDGNYRGAMVLLEDHNDSYGLTMEQDKLLDKIYLCVASKELAAGRIEKAVHFLGCVPQRSISYGRAQETLTKIKLSQASRVEGEALLDTALHRND